ncbi:MAG TPA: phage portal protein [Microthrixaceae bacterium]|nr:phage portal protein [Microthrixaceae bacterium]
MTSLARRILRAAAAPITAPIPVGWDLGAVQISQTWPALTGVQESSGYDFVGRVQWAYKANGVVFACVLARLMLFAEARFQWQRLSNGRPGELFGNADLEILERPWRNGTTGDLLARMEQDVSFAGNSFIARIDDTDGRRLRRLRPDWTSIAVSTRSPDDPAARVIGYLYKPPSGALEVFDAGDVAHYAPIPDPESFATGMSWLSTAVADVAADHAMSRHQHRMYQRAGTPNQLVTLAKDASSDAKRRLRRWLDEEYSGVDNAGKSVILDPGADVRTLGLDMEKLAFGTSKAAAENRIAVAAGVPSVVVGLQAGLDAATYSNYQQALRRMSDLTMRPLWRSAAGALEVLVPKPDAGVRLWHDTRDIAALAGDPKTIAETDQSRAQTIDTLIRAGFEPGSVVAAVTSGDLGLLKHTGGIPTTLYPAGQATTGTVEATDADHAKALAEIIQKIYLGVGKVITSDEARTIVNQAGAGLRGSLPA